MESKKYRIETFCIGNYQLVTVCDACTRSFLYTTIATEAGQRAPYIGVPKRARSWFSHTHSNTHMPYTCQCAVMRAQTQIPTVQAATTRVVVYIHMLRFAHSTGLAAWAAHVYKPCSADCFRCIVSIRYFLLSICRCVRHDPDRLGPRNANSICNF